MSNVVRLLFLLLTLPASLCAQGDVELAEEFGTPGEPGSFRVRFSRLGAGIVSLQALDHRWRVDRDVPLLLIDNVDGNYSLRLLPAGNAPFAKDPATAEWQAERRGDAIAFTLADGKGLVLEKVFRHEQELRGFTVEVTLRNESSQLRGNLPLALGGPTLTNPKNPSLFGDVSVSLAVPVDDGEVSFVKAAADGAVQQLGVAPSVLQFAGSTNRFFGAFVWPKDDASRAAMTRFDVETVPGGPDSNPGMRVLYGLNLSIPDQGAASTVTYGVYLGPKSYRVFDSLPAGERDRFRPVLELDLNPPCCGGITVPGGRPMAKLLLWLLGVFYDVLGNWGVAIILLTFLVRGAMSPLNFRMQKSMRQYGAKMAKLKPKLDALKKQHGDDQKAYQQAMIAFQREHKIMPPIGGCLPIFLTMPIYIGLFTALRTAYDLRHQPFALWIDDLSSSDALFALPFWPGVFNLLPLLWISLFLFMSLRQPLPTDPQQRQMQSIMRFMPMIFGVMLYNYASALLLYMVTSMIWSLIESTITKKILGPIDPNAAAMAPTPI